MTITTWLGRSLFCCAVAAVLVPVSALRAEDKVMRSGEFADDVFAMGDHVMVEADILQDLIVSGSRVDVEAQVKGDVFATGGRLNLSGDIEGSLLAAGGRIEVDGNINESTVIFGGDVDVNADIDGDVLVTAGNVDITGTVKGDLRGSAGKIEIHRLVEGNVLLGGGKVELRDSSHIKGKATIGAASLYIGGRIERGLKAGAREIVIAGVINGDVKLTANQITLLPSARIMGDLTYRSPQAMKQDDASQVSGDVTYIHSEEMRKGIDGLFAVAGATHLIIITGLVIVAALVIFIAPPMFPSLESRMQGRKLRAIGLGLVFLIGMPILMTLLTVSAIGLPLALILSALYFLVFAAGLLAGSYAVGQKFFTLARLDFRSSALKQIAASAVGLIFLGLIMVIPVAGVVIFSLTTALGIGAFLSDGFKLCRGQGSRVAVPG